MDRYGIPIPKKVQFKKNDRKIKDFSGVPRPVPKHKQVPTPPSMELDMDDDEEGNPFKIVTSKEYEKRVERTGTLGMVDMSMDFMQATIDVRESKITKPEDGEIALLKFQEGIKKKV